MKKIKYITSAILIGMGLILTGEINALQKIETLNAQPPYPCVIYDFGGDWRAAADDIIMMAERNGILVFAYNDDYASMLERNFVIYSTQKLPADAAETMGVGVRFKSLLLGDYSISADDFGNIPKSPTSPWLYFLGNKSDIDRFNSELSLLYPKTSSFYDAAAGFPYNIIQLAFWAGILICIIFLTLVDAYFQKKEVFVRVIFGASLSGLVIRNILSDMAVYLALFTSGFLALLPFTSVWYNPALIWIAAGTLISVNSLAYLVLYRIDHKYATSKSKMPKRILQISYAIKSIIALPAILAITGTIIITHSAVKYMKAYSFFNGHKDYYLCEFQYKSDVSSIKSIFEVRRKNDDMNMAIYTDYYDICEPVVLYGFSLNYTGDIDVIYANSYAYNYITSAVGGFTDEDFDMVVLIPEGMTNDKAADALVYAKYLVRDQGTDYTLLKNYYSAGADVLCMDPNNPFLLTFAKDPIIIFEKAKPTAASHFPTIFYGTTMYRLTDEIHAEIIERFDLEGEIATVTNAFDHYNHYWFLIKAGIFAAALIGALTLLLEIVMVFRIIDLEYKVNAMELCLKKIFGYGIWRRNTEIIVTVYGFDFLCAAVAFLIFGSLGGQIIPVAIAAGLIFLIDTIALLRSILRIERARVPEILKGGAL